MFDKIITWAVPFVLGGAATGILTYLKMARRKHTALENGVQCLLRAEIIRNHDKYMEKRHCPIYAKEALKRAYTAYHALGGTMWRRGCMTKSWSCRRNEGRYI